MKQQVVTIDGVEYVPVQKMSDRVLVRCRNAGVHVGTLVTRDSDTLVLSRANRIWRWTGAHDLSYVAMHGVDRSEFTRISCEVPSLTLTCSDVCEVIPVAAGVDLTEVENA